MGLDMCKALQLAALEKKEHTYAARSMRFVPESYSRVRVVKGAYISPTCSQVLRQAKPCGWSFARGFACKYRWARYTTFCVWGFDLVVSVAICPRHGSFYSTRKHHHISAQFQRYKVYMAVTCREKGALPTETLDRRENILTRTYNFQPLSSTKFIRGASSNNNYYNGTRNRTQPY
jgi:hypothetical protein